MKKVNRYLWLLLFAIFSVSGLAAPQVNCAASPPAKSGTVTGSFVVKNGGTMAGGQVLFFNANDGPPPLYAQRTRVPDIIVQIDAGSNFAAILPVGKYYLLAAKRQSGKFLGPPSDGDYGFRLMDGKGQWKAFSVEEEKILKLGTMIVKFQGKRKKSVQGVTAITGVLKDHTGHPADNGVVFAFSSPQMQGSRAQFISNRTGADGKYVLQVAGGSTYYLMARTNLGGGQVAEGEIIGIYGNKEPTAVSVQAGETVRGIDIGVIMMGHRGPEVTDGSMKILDPAKQQSKKPSWLPPTLPGSLRKENSGSKIDAN